jgi:hypothetical protein
LPFALCELAAYAGFAGIGRLDRRGIKRAARIEGTVMHLFQSSTRFHPTELSARILVIYFQHRVNSRLNNCVTVPSIPTLTPTIGGG